MNLPEDHLLSDTAGNSPKLNDGRRLVISSMPCGGSSYLTYVFRRQGLDFRHEAVGADGGCGFAVGPTHNFRAALCASPETYGPFYHLSRHPLKVIPGLFTFSRNWVFNFCIKQIPSRFERSDEPPVLDASPLHILMKFWYYWTLSCLRDGRSVIRLEDFSRPETGLLQEIAREVGYTLSDDFLLSVPMTTASKRTKPGYRRVTWGELEKEDAALTYQMRVLSSKIGHMEEI